MSAEFPTFAKLVSDSFMDMAKTDKIFVTDIDGDALYARYLASFPPGTNQVHRKATEHECSSCKHFIRRAGAIVVIGNNSTVRTTWDEAAVRAPYPYNVVARELRDAVLAAPISDLFRVGPKEAGGFGQAETRSMEDGRVVNWTHVHTGLLPRQLVVAQPDTERGNYRTTVQVFERGLEELSLEAVDTVLSMIDANTLYRGAEHRAAVVQFQQAQVAYQRLSAAARRTFIWTNATGPAARFRNTVIGTLVQDLSEG